MKKKPLIILSGPTAVGKTALSVDLAAQIKGEIISADSMQVYRRMNIGTAKIKEEETGGIPHYLIDILEPEQPFSIVAFRNAAWDAMNLIYRNGHIPILTGGTGFYIQSVLYDIDFNDAADNPAVRRELEEEMKKAGPENMHEKLSEVDPASAEVIHPNNKKRVIRALEFYRTTGKRISEHNEEQHEKESPYDFRYFVLTMERASLYRRIEMRVDQMMEDGLVEEVKMLRDEGCTPDMTSMQGLGYREIYSYLNGESTWEDAVLAIKEDTRHFAKRQLTWFRREKETIWIKMEDYDFDRKKILKKILSDCEGLKEWENAGK